MLPIVYKKILLKYSYSLNPAVCLLQATAQEVIHRELNCKSFRSEPVTEQGIVCPTCCDSAGLTNCVPGNQINRSPISILLFSLKHKHPLHFSKWLYMGLIYLMYRKIYIFLHLGFRILVIKQSYSSLTTKSD